MLQSYLRLLKTSRTFLARTAVGTLGVPRTARTRWIVSMLVLGLVRTTFAQSQPTVSSILTGQLVNAGNAGVANAIVQWSIPGVSPTENITDANGNFAFEIPLSASAQLEVSAISNRYNPAQASVTIQPGETTQVKLQTAPKSSGQLGTVTGIVANTSGTVIPNAKVSILGAGGLLTTLTNKTGKYQIENVGFNSDLILQVSTAAPPCIATTQVPLAVAATEVTANLQVRGVHTIEPSCPAPLTLPAGAAQTGIQPQTGVDDTVQWEQADGLSIASTGVADGWNAGRVNDVLRFPPVGGLDGGLLVASDEGGVWWILTAPDIAMALSNKWTSVTMSSLALGTGGPHDVYAGTFSYGDSEGGDLWESDTSQSEPLNSWARVSPKPPCGSINKILVISEANFLVLACDTGLYWSQIPAPPSVHGIYNWQQAVPATMGADAFSGLAKGPGWSVTGTIGTIVASRWGTLATSRMIYTATLKGGQLVLTPASVGGVSERYNRTSVAACATNPQIMYAVGSVNGSLGGVFQSTDAGAIWNPVTRPANPGTLGESDQAIAVSPDCSTVALGWETGTFVSTNQGASWNLLTDVGEYNNLHTDITALTFDAAPANNLFIGSAGGVAESVGVDKSVYVSEWNKLLFNLELFQGSPSDSATGLLAAASRDNGVLYSDLPGQWQHVMDCPLSPECWGNVTTFAPFDRLIAENVRTASSTWGAEQVQAVNGVIPFNTAANIPVERSCSPCTPYTMNVVAPVRVPGYVIDNSTCIVVDDVNECEVMYAVSEMTVPGAGGDGIYGLFTYPGSETDIHWELLNSGALLWSTVTAIAPTFDGQHIFIGNTSGQIYRLDYPFTGPAAQLTVNLKCPSCGANGLYAFTFDPNAPQLPQPGLAFAAYGPHFLAYDGTSWNEVGQADLPHNDDFLSVLATDPSHLWLASSAGVFDSKTGGATWSNASVGLPTFIAGLPGFRQPSLASHDYLQIVSDPPPNQETRLYLSSFGRSVWRTITPLPAPPAARAFPTVNITIQTGNDNLADYSELQAWISPPQGVTQYVCLKPSTTSDSSYNNTCPNGPGATDMNGNTTWNNGQIVYQTFNLGAPTVLDQGSVEIILFQHNGINTPDNWDLQAIEIDGQDTQGTLPVLEMSNGPVNGNNCLARFKAPPFTALAIYLLSGDDPEGINVSHSISTFGPTPPGSCPQ